MMPNNIEDLQMLRLIKAFQKVKDEGARRMILLFVEERVENDKAIKLAADAGKTKPAAMPIATSTEK
ncbi:hypothetical protein IVB38_37450 [Bradyrhizobium sp. 38]|uniref:hypothetical protein n=1 Tax=unclassified Bradyrhizobium TaxID=2631580 RepID=UPI001FF74B23|nr:MULTISPECIES: hypothetical protein [unclassified Bradyrhizobium]MCK1341523.1 hypothetical protein [Bradyrhizobium sp. 38]MCK1781942.1 hypothetical protein [Bradyrhizobium sp. 132]